MNWHYVWLQKYKSITELSKDTHVILIAPEREGIEKTTFVLRKENYKYLKAKHNVANKKFSRQQSNRELERLSEFIIDGDIVTKCRIESPEQFMKLTETEKLLWT